MYKGKGGKIVGEAYINIYLIPTNFWVEFEVTKEVEINGENLDSKALCKKITVLFHQNITFIRISYKDLYIIAKIH